MLKRMLFFNILLFFALHNLFGQDSLEHWLELKFMASLFGIIASVVFDLPTGAAIVGTYGFACFGKICHEKSAA